MGRRRRRRRQVGIDLTTIDRERRRHGHHRAGRATGAPRSSSPLAGPGWASCPFFLFAACSLACRSATWSSAASRTTRPAQPTLQNYAALSTPLVVNAFRNSIEISLVTAILGGIFGFLLALRGHPRRAADAFLRGALMTFSGVASNFAGVPLALAFIFTLGHRRVRDGASCGTSGSTSTPTGSRSTRKLGIEIVYLYFQFPLMVLIIAPAIDGLRQEWREAAENMGASPRQYWRHVALPILMPDDARAA